MKICKRIFLLCVVNVEKVMITVQTPNDADEWPILICHDNEVPMYRVLAGLILEQEVALCLVCVELGRSGLTVEAKIVLWRFQPKSQPDLTFQNNSLFFPLILLYDPLKMMILCWGKQKLLFHVCVRGALRGDASAHVVHIQAIHQAHMRMERTKGEKTSLKTRLKTA